MATLFGDIETTRRTLHTALRVVVGVAIAAILVEYGCHRPPLSTAWLLAPQGLAVALYVALQLLDVRRLGLRSAAYAHWREWTLIAGMGLLLAVSFPIVRSRALHFAGVVLVAVQVLFMLQALVGLLKFNLELAHHGLKPAKLLMVSFVVLIFSGTVLLAMPRATNLDAYGGDVAIAAKHLLNCLFTSASAACVTGLVVYDTGVDFTRFGQVIILLLIQVGGLGIMLFSTVFGMLLGRQMSLRQSLALQDELSHQTVGQIRRMVRFVVVTTFACEAVGAVMLWPMWGADISWGERAFQCAFHAVSAFCNAGFALRGDSLCAMRNAWPVFVAIMPLIVLGGLGFPVLHELFDLGRRWLRKTWEQIHRNQRPWAAASGPSDRLRLSLHAKLVLVTTALLIAVPLPIMFLIESWPDWRTQRGKQTEEAPIVRTDAETPMIDLPFASRAGAVLFQTVTTRTAGFNTVRMDEQSLSPATHFLMCVLMFVGGSPGSTAGGVKTTTIAVLVVALIATLRGREQAECFGRTIPTQVVNRAAVIVVLMFGAVTIFVLLISYTESVTIRNALFEVVSACATVGLSTGLTPELTVGGRVTIIVAMFIGRVGPLTVLIALAGRDSHARYQYPFEQPMIG